MMMTEDEVNSGATQGYDDRSTEKSVDNSNFSAMPCFVDKFCTSLFERKEEMLYCNASKRNVFQKIKCLS